MSDIVVPGFKSSELIAELNKVFEGYSADERAKLIKQVRKYMDGYASCARLLIKVTTLGQWCLPVHHQELRRQGGDFHH